MEKGSAIALVILGAGFALVLLAVPSLDSEVVASEEFTVETMRPFYWNHTLPKGSYTVWFEDFRETEETGLWHVSLERGSTEYSGDWPDEVLYQEFEGVESELIKVIGDVPEGVYVLNLEYDDDDLNGTTLQVFLVRSPGTIEGFLVVTGITLMIAAVIVVLIARKRPGEVPHG
jgi:hypothetical protein